MSDPEHGRGKDDDDPQRIKEQLARDNRDITDLWNESLRKYKLIVGVELTGINDERVLSIGEMVNFGTEQMNKFHKFRHDAKKVDRLRSLLKDNLDYIDEGTKQLVSAATPAFPPAAAIGTAFTLLLTACRQVSADYDVVTAFFEDMNSFLQRTSILQSRLPRYPAYLNCLMDVFTALLEMCGFATRYIELGRFKKWIVNLFNGEDGELADARKKMDNAVSRLQSATEFAILGNTEELQRMNADLKQNQELQVKRMEDQSRLIERVLTRQDSVRNELSDIRKLLLVFNERKAVDLSNEGGMNNSRSNPSSRSRIRSVFADAGDPSCEYNEVKESLVPETCTWIFEEPEWTRWLGQVDEPVEESTRILLVSGSPGIGKSHLAAASFDKLVQRAGQCQDDARSATCVAHFYFRAINGGTSKFYQAINWIAVQIAEQNASLGERISSLMEMDSMEFDPCVWQEIWGSFIQPFFSTTGEASQLQIVLDGLDELKHRQDIREMRDFLKLVQDTPGLRVRVLCTARTAFLPKLEQLRSASTAITVTKSKILPDLRALIWHHLNTNSRLRHMSRHTKQRVSSKLEEVSDGMLYAEHMLRQFDSLGREALIARQLEQPLPVGIEGLYSTILTDLERRTLPHKLPILKGLLAWLAFSVTPLSLADCLSLERLIPGGSIDFDEELQHPPLSRFLKIGAADERLQSPGAQAEREIDSLTRLDLTGPFDDSTHPVKFQEHSMREYFRSAGLEETTAVGLRTSARAAHALILSICSRVLTGDFDDSDGTTITRRLRNYAGQCWLRHMYSWTTHWDDGGHDEEENVATLEAIGAIVTNRNHVAKLLVSLNMDYAKVYRYRAQAGMWGEMLKAMRFVALKAVDFAPRLNTRTLIWARKVLKNCWAALLPLARGYILAWFRCQDVSAAVQAYKLARSIISLTSRAHLVHSSSDGDDQSSSDDDDNSSGPDAEEQSTEKEILGISQAFSDINMNSGGFWAIAVVLAHFGHYSAALPVLQKALSLEDDGAAQRFRLLAETANIQHLAGNTEEAVKSISECLSDRDVEAASLRKALEYRAQIYTSLQQYDLAAESYREARLANLGTPFGGDLLKDEFQIYQLGVEARMEPVTVVKEWTPLERLTWMTWNYDNSTSQHTEFTQSCGRTGEHKFMVSAYEEAIELLDRIGSSAPIRYQLARAYWTVCGDTVAARACVDAILESTSSGNCYWLTDEDPTFTLGSVVALAMDIIVDEFRCTADPVAKAALLDDARGLVSRNLAQSVTLLRSDRVDVNVGVALMLRLMGPATEYHDVLQEAFTTSFEMIPHDLSSDEVSWSLFSLARIISLLDGFDRETQILISVASPGITTSQAEGSSSVGNCNNNDNDDDDATDEEGEDVSDDEAADEYWCQGECTPVHGWKSWEDGPMYMCLICSSSCRFCEPCYRRRQEYNNDHRSRRLTGMGDSASLRPMYCGMNHRYVRAPLPGWRGVKKGILRIEGEKEVIFTEWLADLRENKWKAAWERFWLTDI